MIPGVLGQTLDLLAATTTPGDRLLSLKLGPTFDRSVSPFLEVADQRGDRVRRMKNITAAGNFRQSFLKPGAESPAEIGDGSLRSEAPVNHFQQPNAPGIGVSMLFRTQQEAEGGFGIDNHKDRIAGLVDLIKQTDANAVEVVLLVNCLGRSNSGVHDVVHVPTESR